MSDFYGGKQKFVDIPVQIGVKIPGTIVELKANKKYDNCINVMVEFPEYKATLDGGKEVVKKGVYLISTAWSETNKSGMLYYSLNGKFPNETETINWNKALVGKKVCAIYEGVRDKTTGEMSGQKMVWLGNPNAHLTEDKIITDDTIGAIEEIPF